MGVYQITNKGKDEEITHSTYLSRSIGEGIREEWNIYLSIPVRVRGGENVQLLRTFFPIIRNKIFRFSWNIYVPYQNRTYFWENTYCGDAYVPMSNLSLFPYDSDIVWSFIVPTLHHCPLLSRLLHKSYYSAGNTDTLLILFESCFKINCEMTFFSETQNKARGKV